MSHTRKKFLQLLGMGSLGTLTLGFNSRGNSNEIIKPRHLKKGDTIGMISPAGILPDPERYGEIDRTIRGLGFKIKRGKHSRNRNGYLAGTDRERAEDLNTMFDDDKVQAILPYRGGWGSNRILEYLDYDLIGNKPKILFGFSDITSLLLAIYSKTGLVTYHGPVGKSNWTDFTFRQFKRATMETRPFTLQNLQEESCSGCMKVKTITPGRASGRLLGGNLTVLTSMLGSGFLPEWDNFILFLEDVGEDYYRIDRMLTQLKMNGILGKANAFIFGQCSNCAKGQSYSFSLEQIFHNHVKPLGIPAFSGSMIGHIDNMFTVPIGIQAEVDAGAGQISFTESPTR